MKNRKITKKPKDAVLLRLQLLKVEMNRLFIVHFQKSLPPERKYKNTLSMKEENINTFSWL
jgi:hypothetical protein